ncbi:MAG TPA: carboxypeptidase-like regulatory domain-containing protein, partial [Vicinamibacterales bacterium]
MAQSGTTGAIAGEVKDATGAVLPGVTVEAASPALIEKIRTVVTDASGRYQIVDLRPGVYTVTFQLPGFSTVRREGLELNTGFTATVDADMRVGGVEETITVSGASPVVDITNTRQQSVLTREVLDTLPTSKSVQALAAVTLGALTTGALGGGEAGGSKGEPVFGFAQIHGSQNGIRTLDGMKLSSAYNVSLAARNQFNQMMVQEIVMETSAAAAESESSGLNSNMVPKDGGNQFHWSFNVEGTNNSLQSDNLNDDLRARGLTSSSQVQKIYDLGFGIGGP